MYYSIIYQSNAKENFFLKEIEMMLLKAKYANKRNNITGCIVYSDDTFIQLIQGPKKAIIQLYDNIKADTRHTNVDTLIELETKETLWNKWSMAILNFSGSSDQNMSSRIMLESYFENVNENQKSSEVYKTFKMYVLKLLKNK